MNYLKEQTFLQLIRDYSNFDWDSLYANLKKEDLMARRKGEGSIYYIEKRKNGQLNIQ